MPHINFFNWNILICCNLIWKGAIHIFVLEKIPDLKLFIWIALKNLYVYGTLPELFSTNSLYIKMILLLLLMVIKMSQRMLDIHSMLWHINQLYALESIEGGEWPNGKYYWLTWLHIKWIHNSIPFFWFIADLIKWILQSKKASCVFVLWTGEFNAVRLKEELLPHTIWIKVLL